MQPTAAKVKRTRCTCIPCSWEMNERKGMKQETIDPSNPTQGTPERLIWVNREINGIDRVSVSFRAASVKPYSVRDATNNAELAVLNAAKTRQPLMNPAKVGWFPLVMEMTGSVQRVWSKTMESRIMIIARLIKLGFDSWCPGNLGSFQDTLRAKPKAAIV
jgi:hypothetical protein